MAEILYIKKKVTDELPVINEKVFLKTVEGDLFVGFLNTSNDISYYTGNSKNSNTRKLTEIDYWLKKL